MTATIWPWPWERRGAAAKEDGAAAKEDGPAEGAGSAVGAGPAAQSGDRAAFGPGGDREGDWETVYVAATLEEAHIVRGRLEVEGFPVLLAYDSLNTVYGMTASHGVRIRVPRALAERARALLAE